MLRIQSTLLGIVSCVALLLSTLAHADELPDDVDQLIDMLVISKQQDSNTAAYQAYKKLGSLGPSAFPKLVSHLNDKRPSIAIRRVSRHDVGLACFSIIEGQIFPVPRDYRGSFYRTGADGKRHERPLFLKEALFNSKTLPKWLEERNDKSLREMRIEAIRWLIGEEKRIGFQDEDDKKQFLYPLERRLNEIERNLPFTEPEETPESNQFDF